MGSRVHRNPDEIPVQTGSKELRKISIGEMYYLSGFSTKIEVVGKPETFKPECKILEIKETSRSRSKFKIGQVYRISRQILYPNKARTSVRKRRSN
jgi:hypothetical protein